MLIVVVVVAGNIYPDSRVIQGNDGDRRRAEMTTRWRREIALSLLFALQDQDDSLDGNSTLVEKNEVFEGHSDGSILAAVVYQNLVLKLLTHTTEDDSSLVV